MRRGAGSGFFPAVGVMPAQVESRAPAPNLHYADGPNTKQRMIPPMQSLNGAARPCPAPPRRRRTFSCAAAILAAALLSVTANATAAPSARAQLGRESVAPEVRSVADWVARSGDHGGTPFVIVDKRHARVFVFDANAQLTAHAPVLLGAARGDDSVPGIGERPIRDIKPAERTTPAGRFVAEGGRNLRGDDIVWIDYDAAVSMHRVITSNPSERRLERLASPTYADNRISYGCINVPVAFFNDHISPIFSGERKAIVYVLPEVHALRKVFPGYDGAEPGTRHTDPAKAKPTRVASTQ